MSEPSHDGANPHVRFEPTDVPARPILKSFAWLLATMVTVLVILWFLGDYLARREAAAQPPPPPLDFPADRKPPAPNLLADEPAALRSFLLDEEAILTSYGHVDPEKGVVRIPIEEAIRRLAARGLPVQAAGETAPAETASPAPSPSPAGHP